jgi:hypothetical protein
LSINPEIWRGGCEDRPPSMRCELHCPRHPKLVFACYNEYLSLVALDSREVTAR